ncbi:ribosomal protein L24e-related [Kipferlia bialata]|uniref:Ribosomal protein L24e-related n=1 Tax=Kipferlia bialata TaxID=797122 RepID=A0A9K3CQI6_9EUKA|nr:ribosomal protein L24e-related [Kipferlia bialata]|eukprot:g454.t1
MVRTGDTCSYSGRQIQAGYGSIFVRGDGKPFMFKDHKTAVHFSSRWNPRKIDWTLACRRLHKKESIVTVRRRSQRSVKSQARGWGSMTAGQIAAKSNTSK